MANWSKSGSKSTTWEGIEGYVPEFIRKSEMYGKMSTREKQEIALMGQKELSDMYGFVYGDAIDNRYKDAVNAKYDELDSQTRLARDTSLNDMSVGLDAYLDTIRQQNAKRTQTGIMKGASAAQEMQNMFGAQAKMGESQQEYQKTMAALAQERGTATYASYIDALKERNNVANQMGVLGMQKYGYDVQDEASYLSYLGQVGQNQAAWNQAAAAWNASEGQNTRRKTSEASSWQESYDNSADIAAQAQRDIAASQAGQSEKYFNEQKDYWKKQGLTDAQAGIMAGGGSLSSFGMDKVPGRQVHTVPTAPKHNPLVKKGMTNFSNPTQANPFMNNPFTLD